MLETSKTQAGRWQGQREVLGVSDQADSLLVAYEDVCRFWEEKTIKMNLFSVWWSFMVALEEWYKNLHYIYNRLRLEPHVLSNHMNPAESIAG